MGTPGHVLGVTSETKLYRLLTPGSPLFRPVHYDKINLDDFAMGTNAVVAVISYTVFKSHFAFSLFLVCYSCEIGHWDLLVYL